MNLRGVEIFATGRWNDVKTFTGADLDAMAASFAELKLAGRTPLKLGHNDEQEITDGQPALGWVERVWRDGDVLKADFRDLPRAVYDAIQAGRYKFVSVELLRDVVMNGREYPWVLSAVALLGADIPAVSSLADLQALTHARRTDLGSGERLTFTMSNGGRDHMTNDTQRLQAENERLSALLLQQAQDSAIYAGRCIPAERERFNRRYGKAATLADWNEWLRHAQRPANFNRARAPGNAMDDNGMAESAPDAEVVRLAQAEVERSGGRLSYFAAQQKVLKANPELAQSYRYQPGVKDG